MSLRNRNKKERMLARETRKSNNKNYNWTILVGCPKTLDIEMEFVKLPLSVDDMEKLYDKSRDDTFTMIMDYLDDLPFERDRHTILAGKKELYASLSGVGGLKNDKTVNDLWNWQFVDLKETDSGRGFHINVGGSFLSSSAKKNQTEWAKRPLLEPVFLGKIR